VSGAASFLLRRTALLLFAAVILVFGALSPRFLAPANFANILIHASSLGIAAVGMTFVLLTAGIDLSVGSIMFLATVVAGKMVVGAGLPLPVAVAAVLAVGLVYGAVNATLIVRFKVMAFVVTLATLYAGRGAGLMISQTRAMNLPASFTALGSTRLLGLPLPVWAFAAVAAIAHVVLTRTAFGRHVHAVGSDAEVAKRAGIAVPRVLTAVYVVCGACASLAGLVSVAQVGAVSPSFGQQRELAAIAAAVLGGTSLFCGRGQVFPGTVLGALLMQTVESGLVIVGVNPYLYPLVTAAVIFVAVAADAARTWHVKRQATRKIRPARA
jgi:ribose/xylose/arabinose/galactoside ABC-type transport system permease subunit